MALIKTTEDQTFANVLADGKIHVTVPEGTVGSTVRKYKTSDGKEGSKIEMIYNELIGKIVKIAFYEGNFGKQIQISVSDGNGEPVVLSLGTSSNYGEDFMKKLPNIDLEKFVKIVPYSFTDEKGKGKKGVTIWQASEKTGKNEKLKNYFFDDVDKKNLHGYPEPKKLKNNKPLSTDQWKLYFGECREFLVEFITEKYKIEDSKTSVSTADQDFEKMVRDAEAISAEVDALSKLD